MFTARQFAEAINRPYPTVMGWLQKQIVPGARLVESPIGSYYEIPAEITKTFVPPKPGRPLKEQPATKAKPSKKKAKK
jgi:hypothetical protein